MANFFQGTTLITLDVKSRLALPTRHRPALAETGPALVLTAHPEGCALLYPEADWEPVRRKVQSLPSFSGSASWLKRMLIGYAERVLPDASGRVLVPESLRAHARLERIVQMVGQGHYFELWDPAQFAARQAQAFAGGTALPDGAGDFSL